MHKVEKILHGEQETIKLAKSIARYVVTGDIIRLEGTLGMGKSTFARAFIQELAGQEITVPSPTFTIVQTYEETRLPVAHVDAYRLQSGEDLENLDLFDYFDHGITLIEWPQNVEEALPKKTVPDYVMAAREESDVLTVHLEPEGEDARKVTLSANGTWCNRFGLALGQEATRLPNEENRRAFLEAYGLEDAKLAQIGKPLSFRTYWRVEKDGKRWVLMDSPPPMEDVASVVKWQKVYQSVGIHVAHVAENDMEKGFLLLEDFGDVMLSDLEGDDEAVKAWLESCVDLLIQATKIEKPEDTQVYDFNTAFEEAVRYVDWYLPYETGHATDMGARAQFKQIWQKLYELSAKVPFMISHWDFHNQNLMTITGDEGKTLPPTMENVGVLDFQDARFAPVSFDLACLLEDRWQKPLNPELKRQLIQRFVDALDGVSYDEFMVSYNICTLFRCLKITGLYNRASKRDGRTGLPWNMALIWQTIVRALEQPECAELKALMAKLSPEKLENVA